MGGKKRQVKGMNRKSLRGVGGKDREGREREEEKSSLRGMRGKERQVKGR